MNTRSAMLAAAAMVLTMVIVAAAVVVGAVGPDRAVAGAPAVSTPSVRTITRTVTVHRPGGRVVLDAGAGEALGAGSTREGSDDAWEDDDDGWSRDDDGGADDSDAGESDAGFDED